ncbi:TIM-barrel domain-containing protein [Rheinheimera sp. 4Y26]|uniref:TIM-barrel domain-containing protein n=1 Tax=Rheinheimera sp. 4Y26 TaxID=2977811 RepID=UPI0021B153C0|nr:TIM-barrel domain-containing protein [Rheinheimera sp. 4Y26]MCT6698753.1 NPCBM/NEW2 domain-containing protein [Rheinheimera sp. 4Y26]
MRLPFFRAALASALTCCFASSVLAAPVGNLTSIRASNNQLDITTDQQVLLQIQLLQDDLFRLQAGLNGKLSEPGNKAAAIVLPQTPTQVEFQLSDKGDYQLLQTEKFALRIYAKPLKFALYQADNQQLIMQELQPLELGKEQSFQTLSTDPAERFFGGGQQNGAFEFKGKTMEISYSGGWEEGDRPSPAPFYMSSQGYGVLRNSWANGSYDFRSSDYIQLSHNEARFDAYYFVGQSIKEVLADYTALTGRARLIPRWAFEYGDADCYNDGDNIKKPGTVPDGWSDGPTGTTPDVIETVAKKYREHDMPGGWILPNDGYGCGYTDLPKVVAGLAKYGFKTGLWTENGVDKIAWEVGTAGSRAQKLDVAWTGQGYQFALDANKAAADGIFNNSDSRPFLWTVMGWAGIQRYAVTWTGDQSASWDYIRWHIPTLIGSGLSGQAYATGDVDAIFGGSSETYTRDLQWKAFTPVLMGMSGWAKAARKHPWWYDEPYRSINRDYLKLKMRLTPYMYSTAYQAETTGAPIVRGLMWDYAKDKTALAETHKYQFLLGKDLLIAPVYRSMAATKGWRTDVYLPQGQWIDYWDGRVVDAPADGISLDYKVDLKTIPVFVRAGAILPMYPAALYDGEKPKDELTLDIYPYGQSSYLMYEDDGNTRQYQQGKFSQQEFKVTAPEGKAGDISVTIGAVTGEYQGQELARVYQLHIHSRVKPEQVKLAGQNLTALKDQAAFEKANSGWLFSPEKYGVILVKTPKTSIRQTLQFDISINSALALTPTAGYPKAPELGNAIAADSLLVLNRPAEEPGHVLENAFDDNPTSWFRTKRDQALKTGAHEFTLALGERRMVNGFEIAPRNDQHWKYGQVRDYEVYIADNNGEWGEPAHTGQLKLSDKLQKVEFAAKAGTLFRFRVLSTQDQAPDGTALDPMVTAADATAQSDPANTTVAKAFNALLPKQVTPITISEFKVLEQPLPKAERQQLYLSDVDAVVSQHKINLTAPMQMNGLKFRQGFTVAGESRFDYQLAGHWQLFRADVGINDSCRQHGSVQFQIYGDNKLLFDSGTIKAPAVVKPELDIRGIKLLSLRTVAGSNKVCANWANASLIGFAGDKAGNLGHKAL